MHTLYTIHGHNEAKVAAVMDEMRALGAPTIRVVEHGDALLALEGVHRIEAACRLGLAPALDVVDANTPVEELELDIDGVEAATAGDLAEQLYGNQCGVYFVGERGDGLLRLSMNGLDIPRWEPS